MSDAMHPEFRILDAAVPAERAAWMDLWARWPEREVFAHPAFVELFAEEGQESLCAVLESGSGAVLYPFILRPLAREPWGAEAGGRCDLTSPYGYGGAFAWSTGAGAAEAFWDAFDAWAAGRGVVASFARLSLFGEQILPFRGQVEARFPNVVRSLGLDAEALWRDYAHKVRKNVQKAQRAGLRVEVDLDASRFAEFYAIYNATMDRREAKSGYYFPQRFFEAIHRELAGSYAYFHVLDGDKVVSTELVLVSAGHLYSFLGGTVAEAFENRPNDLLKHAVIEWGTAQGKRAFVLGGGYGAADGIFKYKLAFAPSGEVPFSVGMRIHDEAAYAALVAARAAGGSFEPPPGFFPAYRA